MDIVYRKKKPAPRYTENQVEEVPTRARRLYKILLKEDFDLVKNDEKYFSLTKDSGSTNRGFYTSDPNITPANVISRGLRNIPLKFWFGMLCQKMAHRNRPLQNKNKQFMNQHNLTIVLNDV